MQYLKGQNWQEQSHYVNWIVLAFIKISHGRGYAIGLENSLALPITLSEIKAYIELYNILEISDFIEYIQSLDKVFLKYVNDGIDETTPLEPADLNWFDSIWGNEDD